MTSILTPTAWRGALRDHVKAHQPQDAPALDGHMLSARKDWQRRIHGGTLLDFLSFATERAHDLYPALGKNPITERVFVFITDTVGQIAAREIIDASSERALCVSRDAWQRWLDDPEQEHDDAFGLHYECWSVFHRRVEPAWAKDHPKHLHLWVHEEGFALDDGLGRGSQHLWGWDGQRFTLLEQNLTSWSDDDQFTRTHH